MILEARNKVILMDEVSRLCDLSKSEYMVLEARNQTVLMDYTSRSCDL